MRRPIQVVQGAMATKIFLLQVIKCDMCLWCVLAAHATTRTNAQSTAPTHPPTQPPTPTGGALRGLLEQHRIRTHRDRYKATDGGNDYVDLDCK